MTGPFFIVSTGRSGTTTIARALSVVHRVKSRHEPAPQLICESSGYRYGEYDAAAIQAVLARTRGPVARRSIYVESNQTLALLIPEIVKVFPQARFVWLIRNGMDVVASTMQKQWYTGHSENHDRYEDCAPIEKSWIDGRIAADRCGEMSPAEWAALSRFAKCCWYWGYVNRVIEQDLAAHAADRFMTLRLEDLASRFTDLLKWMGVRVSVLSEIPHANPAKRVPYHWKEWSADEREDFARYCGSLMDRLYPGWCNAEGEMIGVAYESVRAPDAKCAKHLWAARLANALLARNTLS